MTPPLLAIVGKKNSGKTTLTVRLCAELVRRGHRVMTIKHGSHTFDIDPVATDTYRHYHEGNAERVVMISPDKFAMVVRRDAEESPEQIAATHLADADLVLCEGYKQSSIPKIEIFRSAAHETPLYDSTSPNAASWQAMVSDTSPEVAFPVFSLSDETWLAKLASWVEQTFIVTRSS